MAEDEENEHFDENLIYGDDSQYQKYKGLNVDVWANEQWTSEDANKCCTGWARHWMNARGVDKAKCAYRGCTQSGTYENPKKIVGAHVVRYDMKAKKWTKGVLIIPLCKNHNNFNRREAFYIKKEIKPVKLKSSGACKKFSSAASADTNYRVVVVKRQAKLDCKCPTGLEHYNRAQNASRGKCAATPCSTRADTVAVVNIFGYGKAWLVPLCSAHSKTSDPVFIERRAYLLEPGKSSTCAK